VFTGARRGAGLAAAGASCAGGSALLPVAGCVKGNGNVVVGVVWARQVKGVCATRCGQGRQRVVWGPCARQCVCACVCVWGKWGCCVQVCVCVCKSEPIYAHLHESHPLHCSIENN